MSYQVIARKWRPQSFGDMVGQSHVTQTLMNALKNDRIHHALLFTGPRGTGKTSSARILAKSLRCPNSENFVPCNKCSSCLEIAEGRSLDVQELDAASNNSVDDIKRLLEGVRTSPSSGKFKIYIIDEVHMLSSAAFNSLLKTLEEPPAHVKFILATTEAHKIPDTILSRCLRFDFKRIPTRQITERLKLICDSEKVKADDEALWLIARQGDGSMRDSQSLLDQVIAFANGALTSKIVIAILGLTDRSLLFEVLNNLLARDPKGMISVVEKLSVSGTEPKLFAQELLETIRNLLIVKVSTSEMNEILDLPDAELTAFAEIAAQMSEEDIHFLFDMALKGGNDIPKSQDPRIVLEMMLLRMASAPRIVDLQSLVKNSSTRREVRPAHNSVEKHEFKKIEVPHTQTVTVTPEPVAPKAKSVATPVITAAAPVSKPTAPAAPAKPLTPEEKWLGFVDKVRDQDALFAAKIENLLFIKEEKQTLVLSIPPKLVFLKEQLNNHEVRKKLKAFIDSLWGAGYSFEVMSNREAPKGESAQTLAAKKNLQKEDELKALIVDHPMVKEAQKIFKGQIQSITELKGSKS